MVARSQVAGVPAETCPRCGNPHPKGDVLVPPAHPSDPTWRAAWERIYAAFGRELERRAEHLLRRYPRPCRGEEDARDAVQQFLAVAMEKEWLCGLARVHCPSRYLAAMFWRFLRGEARYGLARRRCAPGRRVLLDPDALSARCSFAGIPDDEGAWLAACVRSALGALRKAGYERYAEIVEDLLRHDDGGRSSPDLAARLRVDRHRLGQWTYRARRAFLERLRRAVRDLTGSGRRFQERWEVVARALGAPIRSLPSSTRM